MYTVSESYRAKMLDQVQTHRLTGTIDGVSFSEADVIGVSYQNQCTQKNVLVGSVNIGTLKFTLLRDLLNRGDYFEKEIIIYDGLLLGYDENEEPIWEDIPIGGLKFYVSEALWTAAGIDITAYDVMSKLDKPLNISETSSTIYGFCQYIAGETDTVFGMTQEECEALPNGDEIIAPYEEANFETFRDLLSALAQMVGGFAYAAKDGTWKLKSFDDTPVVTIPKNRRISGATFSDFETYYDMIQYTDVAAKVVRAVGDGFGQSMNLGAQPFLQLGVWDARERRALAIVNAIKKMRYTPFKMSALPAFIALDLGDVISLPDDYSEGTSIGAVMQLSYTYNKTVVLNCFGDNPALQSAQGKTDKNIVGLMNNTTQNEVTFYTFTNLDRIEFGSEQEITLASVSFTSAQTTTVKIMHEFIFDMLRSLGEAGSYELRYYLDEELVSYKPRESLSAILGSVELPPAEGEEEGENLPVVLEPVEFSITRDFFYVIRNVTPNFRHTWQVRIITHGIDQTVIDAQNAHIVVEGQRLYGEEYFDGFLEIREDIGPVALVGMGVDQDISESVEFEFKDIPFGAASDDIQVYEIATIGQKALSDRIQMFIESLNLKRVTEDGYQRITEDGYRRISE